MRYRVQKLPRHYKSSQMLTYLKSEYHHFAKGTIAGVENVVISATGYTGSGGFELYCQKDNTAALWDAVNEGRSRI